VSRSSQDDRGSMLVVEEAFDIQSPNFLHELRKIENPGLIKSFADRWKSDPRPWAREQILAFLEDPLSTPGHETLVKRLLRHAEECRDDELMAAFLVAFDRSVRRVRRIHSRFDPATSTVVNEESLMTPRGLVLRKRKSGIGRVPEWLVPYQTRRKEGALLFSYRTRYYLRRRVWRYFRKLGFSRPAEYPNAIARALVTYLDQDLTRGENILDSWGLMHALFRYSEALTFKASQIHLREGHGLGELVPFPRFPGIWRTPEAVPVLFSLVSTARARLIRVWAMRLLEAEHVEAFRGLDHEQILCFLEHDDDEVQQFGSRLLAASPLLAKLSVDGWLRLLETRSVTALNTVCSLMKRHVSTERFTVAQCVTIASARETPVASMGLEFLKARSITPPEAGFLTELADARCAALSGELTRWALDQLEELKAASGESLSRFFDSRSSKTRSQVMKWLGARENRLQRSDPLQAPFGDPLRRGQDLAGPGTRNPYRPRAENSRKTTGRPSRIRGGGSGAYLGLRPAGGAPRQPTEGHGDPTARTSHHRRSGAGRSTPPRARRRPSLGPSERAASRTFGRCGRS